jgi:general secretion pathway protein I
LFRAARLENAGGSAGFTIIEVLIALAVIAVCLAAIGTVVGVTSRSVRSLEQRVALVEVARSVAASLPPHSDRAVVPAAGEILGHRWQIDVAPSPWAGGDVVEQANSPWGPQTVTIHVQSPSGAVLTLQTVRLQRKPGG